MYLKTLSQFMYSGLITRTARAMKTKLNTFAVYIMFINKHMWPNKFIIFPLIFWDINLKIKKWRNLNFYLATMYISAILEKIPLLPDQSSKTKFGSADVFQTDVYR